MIKNDVFVIGIGLGGQRVGYEFQQRNYKSYLINGSKQDNNTLPNAKNLLILDGYDGLAGERSLAFDALKNNKDIIKKIREIGEKVKIVSEGSIYNGKIGTLGAKAPDLPAHNVWFYDGSFDAFMDYEFISIEKEIPTMKEKLKKVLGNFIKRNKEYVIEIYVKNGKTGNMIARILFNKMYCTLGKEKCIVDKDVVGTYDNQIILPYDEIMDCYEERDEYNQQTVYVILKNGMKIEFECCGVRM